MSKKSMIYSFVAKGSVVLAEHTSYSGNFSTLAIHCLQKLPSGSGSGHYTYSCDDGHTFNFLLHSGFETGRCLAFVFLERVKDDFMKRYVSNISSGDDDDDELFGDKFSVAYNLDRDFGPRLKEHMNYFMSHPEELSNVIHLKAQISEVKGITIENIEKVLDRGEKIELLLDKTESLQLQADGFRKEGRQIRRTIWLHNLKLKLTVAGTCLVLVIIFWLITCGGSVES